MNTRPKWETQQYAHSAKYLKKNRTNARRNLVRKGILSNLLNAENGGKIIINNQQIVLHNWIQEDEKHC